MTNEIDQQRSLTDATIDKLVTNIQTSTKSDFERMQKIVEQHSNQFKTKSKIGFAGCTTLYKFQIKTLFNRKKWKFSKRFSQFHKFRDDLARQNDLLTLSCSLSKASGNATESILKISQQLNSILYNSTKSFPRKKFGVDNSLDRMERKAYFQDFVSQLISFWLDCFIAILYLKNNPDENTHTSSKLTEQVRYLYKIYVNVEHFLSVPKSLAIPTIDRMLCAFAFHSLPKKASIILEKEITDCSICLDGLNGEEEIVQLPCGHVFHENCALEWLCSSEECALCRQKLHC